MQLQRIPFANPVGQLVFALTDWLVMPLRRVISPQGAGPVSLVAAPLLQAAQYLLLWLFFGGVVPLAALPVLALFGLARIVLSGLTGLLIVYALLSWVQTRARPSPACDRAPEPSRCCGLAARGAAGGRARPRAAGGAGAAAGGNDRARAPAGGALVGLSGLG